MAIQLPPSTRGYWDAAAGDYDQSFTGTLIGQIQRDAVWRRLDRLFDPGQRVLELNCGTGVDAVHLAEQQIRVLACDIAPRMIDLARRRARASPFAGALDFRVLATEDIAALEPDSPFDGAFSNFSGLNCVEDLSLVAHRLGRLLRPGAPVLLCMLGRLVPWEFVWYLAHGNPDRAFQRLRGVTVRSLERGTLKVQYPPVREIVRAFAPDFRLLAWRGIGVVVPPSYMEHWARRFSRITRALALLDNRLGGFPVLRGLADFVLLEFERESVLQAR